MNITRRSPFISAFGTLALGAALCLAGPLGALADDSPDDAKQPHLKAWSNIIPPAKRFVVLSDFNSAAVLDRETGLVWEQAPDAATLRNWYATTAYCVNKTVGGRKGWRLPSVVELASLINPSIPAPFVPANVFTGFTSLPSANFWSATATPVNSVDAWGISFGSGNVGGFDRRDSGFLAWCVRGPMNADTY